jgi:hypothetical protein
MRLALAIVAACAALPVSSAAADHCEGEKWNIILHSRIGSGSAGSGIGYSSKDIGCAAGEEPNTNYIYPGSTQVLVRFAADLKVASIKAKLSGLGVQKDLTLNRGQSDLGMLLEPALGKAYVYNSAWVDIDPTKTGKITVTVYLDDGPVSDEYRTAGS